MLLNKRGPKKKCPVCGGMVRYSETLNRFLEHGRPRCINSLRPIPQEKKANLWSGDPYAPNGECY